MNTETKVERITVIAVGLLFQAVVQSLRDGTWKTVVNIAEPCGLVSTAYAQAHEASAETGCRFVWQYPEAA